ncbi:hypothetical protein JCM19294_1146 [Nonlabens tegetincola]|uniref:Uncharacterized protein n=1 Tax=Nonlabens tegetincola TaxID=323273 RepID=A0A090Q3R4_9FLAO|nr:hypothetical protein [Nonlabens tegetincola]GAK96837.1 hypothetical protein JCM19294_1146 [Nonlabens tegetincola]
MRTVKKIKIDLERAEKQLKSHRERCVDCQTPPTCAEEEFDCIIDLGNMEDCEYYANELKDAETTFQQELKDRNIVVGRSLFNKIRDRIDKLYEQMEKETPFTPPYNIFSERKGKLLQTLRILAREGLLEIPSNTKFNRCLNNR